MKITLIVVFVGLIAFHQAMAVKPRFPRGKCSLACMDYRKCIDDASMTNADPSPACVKSKECADCSIQPEERVAVKPRFPRGKCSRVCMDYRNCIDAAATNANPNPACVKSKECEECSMQPEERMAVGPRFPRGKGKCFRVCMDYRKCIDESVANANPNPACVKSKECEECSIQPEEQMAGGSKIFIPCLNPLCNPEDGGNKPLKPFCKVQCNAYKKCRAENKPETQCFRPPGCMCDEVDPVVPAPVVPKPVVPVPVVPKPVVPVPVVPKPVVPVPVVPVAHDKCSNEKCANFWMCTWMAPRDEKFACVKPAGCKCDCVAAGICVATIKPEVARNSEPWKGDGEDDLRMPLQPDRGQWAFRKCQNKCAAFHVCHRLISNRDMNRPACEEPVGCNCGPFL